MLNIRGMSTVETLLLGVSKFARPNIELSCAAASTYTDHIYECHSSNQKPHKATTAAIC